MGDAATESTVETKSVYLTLEDDRIITARIRRGAELSLDDLREIQKAVDDLASQRRYRLLVDARQIGGISIEARRFRADPKNFPNEVARAVVVGSPLSSIVASLVKATTRTVRPLKVFRSLEQAAYWLRGFEL